MRLIKSQILGFVFTVVFGTVLHFVYEWSGGIPFLGVIGAANESVWEHLKLLIAPMFIFGIAEYFCYGKKYPNFIQVRLLSVLLGMAVAIVVFLYLFGDNRKRILNR